MVNEIMIEVTALYYHDFVPVNFPVILNDLTSYNFTVLCF